METQPSRILSSLTEQAVHDFGSLDIDRLNFKSVDGQWSIGQCLDHIIVTNTQYLPALNKVATGQHKESFWEKFNPLTNYTGKQMIRTLGPDVIRKYKVPMIFRPSAGRIERNIVEKFIAHQNEMVKLFETLEQPSFSRRVISSPASALITLKIADVLLILAGHEERHLKQAKKLLHNRYSF